MNSEIPEFQSLDEGLDYLMAYLTNFSEDLWEKEFYVDKRWLEIRADMRFHESVLHVFESDGKYMRILEGDIAMGTWEYTLGGLVIKIGAQHELYERVFLNEKFFVLTKHGDHSSKKNVPKYFFLATEALANDVSKMIKRKAEWKDILTVMYNIYKSNTNYTLILVVFFVIVIIMVFFSVI